MVQRSIGDVKDLNVKINKGNEQGKINANAEIFLSKCAIEKILNRRRYGRQ